MVLKAVKQNGLALAYVSEELSADRHVVLEAIKQGGAEALEYAIKEYRLDPALRCIAGIDVAGGTAADEMLP